MHAFVPQFLEDKMQKMFTLNKQYVVTNFQVKNYTEQDKWRCVNMDKQILFTSQTKATEINENEYFIAKNMFDFYDMAELTKLTKQNIYLAGMSSVAYLILLA